MSVSSALCLIAACGAPAAQEPSQSAGPSYVEPARVVANIDESAFERFGRGLESGAAAETADINVNLPILGLARPRGSGLESGGSAALQDYASDESRNWYAQVSETPFGHLVVRGSILRRTDTTATDAPLPSFEAPLVTLGGDEAPDEATAEFVLGGVSYSVSVFCRPQAIEACADENLVREAVSSLDLIRQERAQ